MTPLAGLYVNTNTRLSFVDSLIRQHSGVVVSTIASQQKGTWVQGGWPVLCGCLFSGGKLDCDLTLPVGVNVTVPMVVCLHISAL